MKVKHSNLPKTAQTANRHSDGTGKQPEHKNPFRLLAHLPFANISLAPTIKTAMKRAYKMHQTARSSSSTAPVAKTIARLAKLNRPLKRMYINSYRPLTLSGTGR